MGKQTGSRFRIDFRSPRVVTGTLAVLLCGLVLFFQNCSPGFQVMDLNASLGGGSGLTGEGGETLPNVPVDVPVDPAQPLSVYVRSASATQGDNLLVKLELNKASATDVIVAIESKPGTALETVDFEPVKTSVSIKGGTLSATFAIATNVNAVLTADRALTVQATSATGAAIAQKEATAIIKATLKLDKFKKIFTMADHACGITVTDILKCWGNNYEGGVGIGTTGSQRLPTELLGETGTKQVVGSFSSSCLLTATNTVKCWGLNPYGQLGNGTKVRSPSPIAVAGLAGVQQLAAGFAFNCALLANGSVKCWGRNTEGQLGSNAVVESLTPIEVPGIIGAKSVAAGSGIACVVTATDTLKCWGLDNGQFKQPASSASMPPTDLPGITGVKQVTIGQTHMCAIFAGDLVKCWGSNANGEFGSGTTPAASLTPIEVSGLGPVKRLQAAPDRSMTCAITTADVLKCWGLSLFNIISKDTGPVTTPLAIAGIDGAKEITLGFTGACAIIANDNAKCWGQDQFGSLGNGSVISSALPLKIAGLGDATSVSTSGGNSCALVTGGAAKCWGNNYSGSLGDGTTTSSKIPVQVTGLTGLKQVTAGDGFACAITATDTVKCWGSNEEGQLGNGTVVDSLVPTDVVGLTGVKAISGQYDFTCALLNSGTVKCWGSNSSGSLGAGSAATFSATPLDVVGLTGIKQIATGWIQACAVTATDTVRCWGSNYYGELGNGLNEDSPVPVAVTGLTGVKSVSAGQESTCAILLNGTMKCWGYNEFGQLGNKSQVNSNVPVDVIGLVGAKKAGNDFWHSCAIVDGDTVRCWGLGKQGLLGSNFSDAVTSPNAGIYVRGVRDLSVTTYYSLFVTADGSVRQMGMQGDLTRAFSPPVDVTTPVL